MESIIENNSFKKSLSVIYVFIKNSFNKLLMCVRLYPSYQRGHKMLLVQYFPPPEGMQNKIYTQILMHALVHGRSFKLLP